MSNTAASERQEPPTTPTVASMMNHHHHHHDHHDRHRGPPDEADEDGSEAPEDSLAKVKVDQDTTPTNNDKENGDGPQTSTANHIDEDDEDIHHEEIGHEEEEEDDDYGPFHEPTSKDPEIVAQLKLIQTTVPQTALEIALAAALERKQSHVERLTLEIIKFRKFVSKRKQTYKRKRKDDGAPTRALSAYNLFIKERFAQLAQENEQALMSDDLDAKMQRVPPSNLVTKTGNEWKTLSAEVKAKYEERAKSDKQRYDKEMREYQRPDGYVNKKRSKTGYNMFFSAHVLRLKQSESGVPSERGSVARLVGTAWKQLAAEDKAFYEREADKQNILLEKEGEQDNDHQQHQHQHPHPHLDHHQHDEEMKRQQAQVQHHQHHAMEYNPMVHHHPEHMHTMPPPGVHHPQHFMMHGDHRQHQQQQPPPPPQHLHYPPPLPPAPVYGPPPPYFDYSQHHQRQHHHHQAAMAQGYQPQNYPPPPRHYDG